MKGKNYSCLFLPIIYKISFSWLIFIIFASSEHFNLYGYKIRVRGHLAQRWSHWFDDFRVTYDRSDTILTNLAADQAALHGALAKIRDLGLLILSVENMEFKNDTQN